MSNVQPPALGGYVVRASAQVSGRFVVLVDKGKEFVVATVESMSDPGWNNGQYVTGELRAWAVFCERVMCETSELLARESFKWTRDPIDPDATLAALRHTAAQWRAGRIDGTEAVGSLASQSDSLDAWLTSGGALPDDWKAATSR